MSLGTPAGRSSSSEMAKMGRPPLLAILLATVVSLPVHAADLLANPGFEGGVAAGGIPLGGWYRAYGDANSKLVVQTGDAHSGDRCLRLEAPTIPEKDPAVTIEQAVPVTPGRAYALRFWARGKPVGTQGMVVIVWLAEDRGWLTSAATQFALTDTWTLHRLISLAPTNAALGVARFDIRQPGTAWVDDASLDSHETARLATTARDATVTAGQPFSIELTALDADDLPVPGAPISCALTTTGDARLLTEDASLLSDERGVAVLGVRASSRPGATDGLAFASGSASLRIAATTAKGGQPTSWSVTAQQRAIGPGGEVPVTVQLLGAFGEPAPVAGHAASVAVTGGGSVSPDRITTDRDGKAVVRLRAAPELFARSIITVRDAGGLVGVSDPIVVAPPIRGDAIKIGPNGYFRHPDGTPFVPLGGLYANWVHKVDNGTAGDLVSLSFTDATDEQLRAWFSYLRDNGVTALRAMLRDHTAKGAEPMDIVGRVNPSLLRRWEHMMQLARPFGIRFLVTLHESWYATYAAYHNADTLTACVLPYYTPAELAALPTYRRRFLVEKRMLEQTTDALSDADVLACQRVYLTDLIPRLRANPDILAYEIENEQPNGFFHWTAEQARLVRALDPVTPICISHLGGGLLSADPLPWARRADLDFYTYHIYPGGDGTSREMDYGAAVAVNARYARLGKPAFSGEAIGDEWGKATPEARRLGARDCIWSQIIGGSVGCFFWNTWDEEIKEFRLVPQILAESGLTRIHRARPRVGLDVTHPLADDAYFQSAPGRGLYAALGRAARECFRRGADFDLTFEPNRYAVAVKPDDLAALSRISPEVQAPAGYEAQYLLSEDGQSFLCYLRNIADTTLIQADPGSGWTRARAETRLEVSLHLPLKATTLKVFDLDDGTTRTVSYERTRPLDSGTTDHDMVLIAPTR